MEDIQARMDADELLAERLQQEEREQFTIEEKSRMLVEMIVKRKSEEFVGSRGLLRLNAAGSSFAGSWKIREKPV
ncbi:hypothetical protein Tco_1324778 [Tanacetum coccineum]